MKCVKRYAGAPAFKLDKAWTATCGLAGHGFSPLKRLDAATLRLLLQSSFVDGARYQRRSSWPCGWSLHLLQFGISCQGKSSFFQVSRQKYMIIPCFVYRFFLFSMKVTPPTCVAGSWRSRPCDHWWRLLPVGSLMSLSLWPLFPCDLRNPVTWRLRFLRKPGETQWNWCEEWLLMLGSCEGCR